jgi:hypothetical protein
MLFFETSAKTSYNIDEVFMSSAKEIAKKIESNYYDLTNENCGIKQGMTGGTGSNLKLEDDKNRSKDKKKKKCC